MIFTDAYSAYDEAEALREGCDDVTVETDDTMTQEEIDALPEHPGWY